MERFYRGLSGCVLLSVLAVYAVVDSLFVVIATESLPLPRAVACSSTELKKVQRRLQQTRKQLLDLMSQQQEQPAAAVKNQKGRKQGTGTSQEIEEKKPLANRIAEAQQKLRLHLDDLNYIRVGCLSCLRCTLAQRPSHPTRRRPALAIIYYTDISIYLTRLWNTALVMDVSAFCACSSIPSTSPTWRSSLVG